MLWSELPKEYRDLEEGFDKGLCYYDKHIELISMRFFWQRTPQGEIFWNKCEIAKTISELPPIPQTN